MRLESLRRRPAVSNWSRHNSLLSCTAKRQKNLGQKNGSATGVTTKDAKDTKSIREIKFRSLPFRSRAWDPASQRHQEDFRIEFLSFRVRHFRVFRVFRGSSPFESPEGGTKTTKDATEIGFGCGRRPGWVFRGCLRF